MVFAVTRYVRALLRPRWLRTPAMDPEAFLKNIPMRRLGQTEDISNVVLSLCSEGSYINGGVIVVDGGLTLT